MKGVKETDIIFYKRTHWNNIKYWRPKIRESVFFKANWFKWRNKIKIHRLSALLRDMVAFIPKIFLTNLSHKCKLSAALMCLAFRVDMHFNHCRTFLPNTYNNGRYWRWNEDPNCATKHLVSFVSLWRNSVLILSPKDTATFTLSALMPEQILPSPCQVP